MTQILQEDGSVIFEATVFWASFNKRSDMSGVFQVDAGRLDADTVAQLTDGGFSVKKDIKLAPGEPNFKGTFVTLKSDYAPRVTDTLLVNFPADVLVGNGSRVRLRCKPYDWNFKGRSGTSLGLNTVMVLDLVEYTTASELGLEAEEGGFVFADREAEAEQDARDAFDKDPDFDAIDD